MHAIGKIDDLYAHRSITSSQPTLSNQDGMEKVMAGLEQVKRGLLMANLVEFDQNWGHRNDTDGFKAGLEAFDCFLDILLPALAPTDVLMITADHGVDPTTPSTDHSREYIPILVYGKTVNANTALGIRQSFADIGATVADLFHLPLRPPGRSFAGDLSRRG